MAAQVTKKPAQMWKRIKQWGCRFFFFPARLLFLNSAEWEEPVVGAEVRAPAAGGGCSESRNHTLLRLF